MSDEYGPGVRPPITDRVPDRPDLVALYSAVGWSAYTDDPERLVRAVQGSLWVRTVWEDGRLVALARAVGDGETICYLQDVLVHPDHRRRGLGRALVQACLDDHADVRQFVLLTDDRAEQEAFYAALGLTRLDRFDRATLHAWVRLG